MNGIVQPSLSRMRTADTLLRGRKSDWEIKEASFRSPEREGVVFAVCSLLFIGSVFLPYDVGLSIYRCFFVCIERRDYIPLISGE